MTVSITCHEGRAALEALRDAYCGLAERVPQVTLFNGWPWLHAAAAHLVPAGREIVVLSAWCGTQLVGCLPLTRGREFLWGLPARTLRFLGHPLADRLALPIAGDVPGALEALLDALVDPRTVRADIAILGELPRRADSRGAIERWSGDRRRAVLFRHCSRAPVLDVSRGERLRASYSKSLRTRLARARKRLQSTGTTRFERHLPRPGEEADLLAAIAAVERESWKGEAGTGIFSEPARRDFFSVLSHDLAAEGRLEICLLRLDGDIASYRYGFRTGRTYLDYNFAYPKRLEALSVGRVLLDEVIVSAAQSGLDTIDASRGSLSQGNILQDWTDDFIDHDELWLFAASAWGDCLSLAIRKAKPAAKRLISRLEPV